MRRGLGFSCLGETYEDIWCFPLASQPWVLGIPGASIAATRFSLVVLPVVDKFSGYQASALVSNRLSFSLNQVWANFTGVTRVCCGWGLSRAAPATLR